MGWWPGGSGSCVACCSCELYCRAPRRAAVEHYPPHTADQACQTRQLVGSRAHGSDPLCRRSRPLWGDCMAPPHARAAGPDLSHLSAPPVPPDAPAADIAPAHRPSVANSTRVHWRRRAGSSPNRGSLPSLTWPYPGHDQDDEVRQHVLTKQQPPFQINFHHRIKPHPRHHGTASPNATSNIHNSHHTFYAR